MTSQTTADPAATALAVIRRIAAELGVRDHQVAAAAIRSRPAGPFCADPFLADPFSAGAVSVSRYTRLFPWTRMARPARWLHAAANASAALAGPSTPRTNRPALARAAASAAAVSGARPAISSGTDGSCRKAPRGPLPSGGSHQPNSGPGPPADSPAA